MTVELNEAVEPDLEERAEEAAADETAEDQATDWRKRRAEDTRGTLERRHMPGTGLEIRESDEGGISLTGYASVTDTPYDVGFYTETIKRGAFKRTLREDPDVQLLINHEGLPLARTRSKTMRLSENDRGLFVEADLDPDDPDVQSLVRKMKRGDIDQMSFAFQATDYDFNEDFTERTIRAVSIHRGDVSVVNQGANPATSVSVRDFDDALMEVRAGKTISSANMDHLSRVRQSLADATDSLSDGHESLSLVMGESSDDESEDDVAREVEIEETETHEPVEIPDTTIRARQVLALLEKRR